MSAQRARKNVAAEIENLQSIIGDKQSPRDAVERQRFAEKHVIHSTGAIHLDLQTRVLAAAKLVNAIRAEIRRTVEFVRHNSFPNLWLNPENCVGRIQ